MSIFEEEVEDDDEDWDLGQEDWNDEGGIDEDE